MGESHQHHHNQQMLHHHPPAHSARPPVRSGRLGGLRGAGEIVEVQGGHIVRSTGRKDRHSKVFTAKGARDRRVRLSAHTAIQFYDVQDRLGYDRPSKAVDWLIKNAKAAIDELAELPPWHPTAIASSSTSLPPFEQESPEAEATADSDGESSGKRLVPALSSVPVSVYSFGSSGMLPPSLESDAIVDTIKSFFPVSSNTGSSPSTPIGLQSCPPDLLSRTGVHGQDLRLSLQSFQDPILLYHHAPSSIHPHDSHQPSPQSEQAPFSGVSSALSFDASSVGWSEQNQRMIDWNAAPEAGLSGGGSGGYMFAMQPSAQTLMLQPALSQSSFPAQRGPLQSSTSPYIRAWTDTLSADHQAHASAMHQMGSSAASAIGIAAGSILGFNIPARIQDEDDQDGMSTSKPSSATSASRH